MQHSFIFSPYMDRIMLAMFCENIFLFIVKGISHRVFTKKSL